MSKAPVTNQMVLDLALEVLRQVESLDAHMQNMVAEVRAFNEELRVMRERSPFPTLPRNDCPRPC
jgi:hypothetical protein